MHVNVFVVVSFFTYLPSLRPVFSQPNRKTAVRHSCLNMSRSADHFQKDMATDPHL